MRKAAGVASQVDEWTAMDRYDFLDCYDFHGNVEPRPPSCYTNLGR